MSLGAAQAQSPQLILPNQLSSLIQNLPSLSPQELQFITHALQQQTFTQIQQYMLLQQSAAAASPTTPSQLSQTQFYLQNQVIIGSNLISSTVL